MTAKDDILQKAKAANSDRGNAIAMLVEDNFFENSMAYFRKANAANIPIEDQISSFTVVVASAIFAQFDMKADPLLKAIGAAEVTLMIEDSVKHVATNYIRGGK